MQKTAAGADAHAFLAELGDRVRGARAQRGMSRRMLARESGVSERYVAQLEGGQGNVSVLLLRQLARALGIPLAALIGEPGEAAARAGRIALIGLRGAGKTTLGTALAVQTGVPFIELDREIERESGVSLGAIFDIYGQAGFRRLERVCLDRIVDIHPRFVLATGGSIVSEPATFERLRAACFTVWLRATPTDHMQRVIDQGDMRPMANNHAAMDDLQRILAGREPLYAKADARIDTSGKTVAASLAELVACLPALTAAG